MKIEIVDIPHFELHIDEENLDALIKIAKMHYDRDCKNSAEIGGILYGFKNYFWDSEKGEEKSRVFSNREIQLIAKIIEIIDYVPDLESKNHQFLIALQRAIFDKLKESNNKIGERKCHS